MPNAAKIERGSILLAHFAEEVFAHLLRIAGGSSIQIQQTLAETSLLAMLDTPDTYEDTAGLPLLSNGSATTFTQVGRVGIADDAVGPGQIDPDISPAAHVAFVSFTDDFSDIEVFPPAEGELVLLNASPAIAANGVHRYGGEGVGFERWTSDAQKMRLVHVMKGAYAGKLFELVTDGAISVGSDPIEFRDITSTQFGITADSGDEVVRAVEMFGEHGNEVLIGTPFLGVSQLTIRGEWIVDLVADTNVALDNTTTTVDGTTIVTGMLVATPNQTTGADRDVWIASTTGAWTRYGVRLVSGQLIRVKRGTRYAGTLWELMTTAAITRGTTSLKWWRNDGRLISWLPATPDANNTIPSYLGRMYIPLPNLATVQRIYTLPADPIPGQEIWINYNATGTAQVLLRRNGTQTINGGTADHGIAVTNYRRAIAVYDLPTNNWLVNSFAV